MGGRLFCGKMFREDHELLKTGVLAVAGLCEPGGVAQVRSPAAHSKRRSNLAVEMAQLFRSGLTEASYSSSLAALVLRQSMA